MEENTTTQAEGNSETNQSTQAEEKKDNTIPQYRFNEVLGRAKSAEAELQKRDKADEIRRQKSLEDKGQFETILNEKDKKIDSLTSQISEKDKKIDQWSTYEAARRETINEDLPEEMRKFTASMSFAEAEDFAALHNSNKLANANKTNSSRAGVNPSGEFGGYSSYAEWAMKDPKGCEAHLANTTDGYIK